MPEIRILFARSFSDGLDDVNSEALLGRIESVITSLSTFPDLGSRIETRELSIRYGGGLRRLPVGPFLLLYRHEGDVVNVLALVSGSRAR